MLSIGGEGQSYYSIFAANTLLYAVTLTYDPVTLTFDL